MMPWEITSFKQNIIPKKMWKFWNYLLYSLFMSYKPVSDLTCKAGWTIWIGKGSLNYAYSHFPLICKWLSSTVILDFLCDRMMLDKGCCMPFLLMCLQNLLVCQILAPCSYMVLLIMLCWWYPSSSHVTAIDQYDLSSWNAWSFRR